MQTHPQTPNACRLINTHHLCRFFQRETDGMACGESRERCLIERLISVAKGYSKSSCSVGVSKERLKVWHEASIDRNIVYLDSSMSSE